MTKEKLDELLVESIGAPPTDKIFILAIEMYTRKLLLECAKTVCINCNDGNISIATGQAHHRIHRLGRNGLHVEACRASSLFIEGE